MIAILSYKTFLRLHFALVAMSLACKRVKSAITASLVLSCGTTFCNRMSSFRHQAFLKYASKSTFHVSVNDGLIQLVIKINKIARRERKRGQFGGPRDLTKVSII